MEVLYKYFPPDRISVLDSLLFRFTQPKYFNDPFEMNPAVKSFIAKYKKDELITKIKNLYRKEPELIKFELAEAFKTHKLIFNIPFMKKFVTNYVYKQLNEDDIYKMMINLLNKDKRIFFKSLYDKLNNNCGIFSLSATPKNILMWSHYTDAHKGFVIEFDNTHPFFTYNKKDGIIKKQ